VFDWFCNVLTHHHFNAQSHQSQKRLNGAIGVRGVFIPNDLTKILRVACRKELPIACKRKGAWMYFAYDGRLCAFKTALNHCATS
jgi:hypothetical protein